MAGPVVIPGRYALSSSLVSAGGGLYDTALLPELAVADGVAAGNRNLRPRLQGSLNPPVYTAHVQSLSGATITLQQSIAPGDGIAVWLDTGSAASTVSDSQGNTYVQITNNTTSDNALFVATYNGTAGTPTKGLTAGTDTITATGQSTGAIIVQGVHGIAPVAADAAPAFASGTSASPSGPATGTLSQAGDIVLAGFAGATALDALSWGGGFSGTVGFTGGGAGIALAAQVAPSTSSIIPSATLNSSTSWTGLVVALKPIAAMTVTYTSGAQVFPGGQLRVIVLTGQASSPIGTTGQLVTAYELSLTPAATGSWIYGCITDNTTLTFDGTTTLGIDNNHDATNSVQYGTFRSLVQTTASVAVSVGASSPSRVDGAVCAVEILAGAGGLVEDPSEPPVVFATSGTSFQTASFSPPPGSLLVALATGGGSTGSITDSAGLSWTQQQVYTADGFVSIWTAVVPTGGSFAGSSTMQGLGSLTTSPVFAGSATLSGGGTLGASPVLAEQAAMSGQGSLAASPQLAETASLSGLGTLSAATILGASASLSGLGSLTASPAFASVANLTGAGSLTASPVLASTAALTGLGTLTVSPVFAGSASLSGLGSLRMTIGLSGQTISGLGSLTASPVLTATAALSGLGTLTAGPQFRGAASLAGLGSLTASPQFQGSALLSGLGTLTSSPVFAGAALLSGLGTLTATYGGAAAGSATLAGAGTLSASPVLAGAATLTGTGSLSGLWAISVQAALSGLGTLTAAPAFTGAAGLSGSGALSATPVLRVPGVLSGLGTLGTVPVLSVSAALSGLGTLSGAPVFAAAPVLSGTGTLSGAWKLSIQAALSGLGTLSQLTGAASATLAGLGTLAASPVFAATSALAGLGTLGGAGAFGMVALLSGMGNLSAAPVFRQTASLAGVGTLTGLPVLAGLVPLSGTGTLTTSPALAAQAALSGLGNLSASYLISYQGAATFSGSGTLTAGPSVISPGDTGTVTWLAKPDLPRWATATLPPRWLAGPGGARWQADPAPPRWRAGQ